MWKRVMKPLPMKPTPSRLFAIVDSNSMNISGNKSGNENFALTSIRRFRFEQCALGARHPLNANPLVFVSDQFRRILFDFLNRGQNVVNVSLSAKEYMMRQPDRFFITRSFGDRAVELAS